MKIKIDKIKILLFAFGVVFGVSATKLKAQDSSIAFAAADTSRFSPNDGEGWQLFNSYVQSYQNDSARFELIIQHANNLDWKAEQFVGTITYSSLIPSQDQSITFQLLTNSYFLRIDQTGRCYIRFVSGALPTDDPFVIPFKIFYSLR